MDRCHLAGLVYKSLKTLQQRPLLNSQKAGIHKLLRYFTSLSRESGSTGLASEGPAVISVFRVRFDNKVPRCLPIENEEGNFPRQIRDACFSRVTPTPVENPRLFAYSLPALELIGLTKNDAARKELVEYFSGNAVMPGAETLSHCYCGHQYGLFTGQLGDGANM